MKYPSSCGIGFMLNLHMALNTRYASLILMSYVVSRLDWVCSPDSIDFKRTTEFLTEVVRARLLDESFNMTSGTLI